MVATVCRRGVLLSVGLGLLLVAASADAERSWRLPRPVLALRVSLEDDSGLPLPAFQHEGRTFVLGERGRRYAIRIDNPNPERVEVVVSVDGRDAVSGRVADYLAERGYIVPAHGSILVEGFRRSLDDVATFRFSDPRDSYSARLGTPENVGVIGVAVFGERRRVVRRSMPARVAPEPEESSGESRGGRPLPPAAAAPAKRRRESPASRGDGAPRESTDNLGTEYGERRASGVVEAAFERRSLQPDRIVSVRYDDAEGLRRRGIDVYPYFEPNAALEPDPFPARRFAEPPP